MNYYYLLLDLSIITLPILFSANKHVHFFSNWKSALLASTVIASTFLILGIIFTSKGILGLNPVHCRGANVAIVPFEEILFFLVTPFSSIFIYENCKYYLRRWELTWLNRILILTYTLFSLAMTWYLTVDWYILSLITASGFVLTWWILNKSLKKIGVTYLISLLPSYFIYSIIKGSSERGSLDNWSYHFEIIVFSFIVVTSSILVYEFIQKRRYR
ncbi:MAG: lycopene cyclase domain-containing protein [Crocinitomicaceae bacterium]|jgi:lycopene cyclase domain-containing protein